MMTADLVILFYSLDVGVILGYLFINAILNVYNIY